MLLCCSILSKPLKKGCNPVTVAGTRQHCPTQQSLLDQRATGALLSPEWTRRSNMPFREGLEEDGVSIPGIVKMLTFGLRHWFSISWNSRTIFQTSAYLDAEYIKLVIGSHLGQFGYHCSEKSPWSFSKIFNIRASNCPPSSHVPTQTEDKSRSSAVSLEMGSGYGTVVRQPLEARGARKGGEWWRTEACEPLPRWILSALQRMHFMSVFPPAWKWCLWPLTLYCEVLWNWGAT